MRSLRSSRIASRMMLASMRSRAAARPRHGEKAGVFDAVSQPIRKDGHDLRDGVGSRARQRCVGQPQRQLQLRILAPAVADRPWQSSPRNRLRLSGGVASSSGEAQAFYGTMCVRNHACCFISISSARVISSVVDADVERALGEISWDRDVVIAEENQ